MRYMMKALLALAMLSYFAGCAGTSDVQKSGGILLPAAVLGKGISMAGMGLYQLSTPGGWRTNLPRASQAPLDEQSKTWLNEHFAVPLDLDHEDAPPATVGFGSSQFPPPVRDLLVFVESKVGRRFDWYALPQLPDSAMSQPNGVILINPLVIQREPPDTIIFTLFHESGHQILGHVNGMPPAMGMGQLWLTQQHELDADAFAARAMLSANYSKQQILWACAVIFQNNPGDMTHPPGAIRYQNVKNTLGVP